MSLGLARFASRSLLALASLACGASLFACSSDDGGFTSSEFASRYCALFKPCCADAGYPASDQAGCRFFFGSVPIADEAAAKQCLADFEAQVNDPNFCDLTDGRPPPDSCQKAFPPGSSVGGGKKPGAACESSSECVGDATCDRQNGFNEPGICAEFVVVAEGEACIGTKSGQSKGWSGDPVNNQIALCDHDAGFHCQGGTTRVCAKRAQIGETCSGGDSACVDGAHCKGTCVQDIATGSACPTFSDKCNEAAFCADSTKVCEPKLDDGKACDRARECLSGFCDNKTCAKNPGFGNLVLGLVCA